MNDPCRWCGHAAEWHVDRALGGCLSAVPNAHPSIVSRYTVLCPCPGWNSPGTPPGDLYGPIPTTDLRQAHL